MRGLSIVEPFCYTLYRFGETSRPVEFKFDFETAKRTTALIRYPMRISGPSYTRRRFIEGLAATRFQTASIGLVEKNVLRVVKENVKKIKRKPEENSQPGTSNATRSDRVRLADKDSIELFRAFVEKLKPSAHDPLRITTNTEGNTRNSGVSLGSSTGGTTSTITYSSTIGAPNPTTSGSTISTNSDARVASNTSKESATLSTIVLSQELSLSTSPSQVTTISSQATAGSSQETIGSSQASAGSSQATAGSSRETIGSSQVTAGSSRETIGSSQAIAGSSHNISNVEDAVSSLETTFSALRIGIIGQPSLSSKPNVTDNKENTVFQQEHAQETNTSTQESDIPDLKSTDFDPGAALSRLKIALSQKTNINTGPIQNTEIVRPENIVLSEEVTPNEEPHEETQDAAPILNERSEHSPVHGEDSELQNTGNMMHAAMDSSTPMDSTASTTPITPSPESAFVSTPTNVTPAPSNFTSAPSSLTSSPSNFTSTSPTLPSTSSVLPSTESATLSSSPSFADAAAMPMTEDSSFTSADDETGVSPVSWAGFSSQLDPQQLKFEIGPSSPNKSYIMRSPPSFNTAPTPTSVASQGTSSGLFGSDIVAEASRAPGRFKFQTQAATATAPATATAAGPARKVATQAHHPGPSSVRANVKIPASVRCEQLQRTLFANLGPDLVIRPIASPKNKVKPPQPPLPSHPGLQETEIFQLLSGYRHLKDEVTTLKTQLTNSQTLMQEILNNFSAEVERINSRLTTLEGGRRCENCRGNEMEQEQETLARGQGTMELNQEQTANNNGDRTEFLSAELGNLTLAKEDEKL